MAAEGFNEQKPEMEMAGFEGSEVQGESTEPVAEPSDNVNKIAQLLVRAGVDAEGVLSVDRANVWQGFYKDANGNAHVVDMAGVQFRPKNNAEIDEQTFVSRAAPTIIKAGVPRPKNPSRQEKTALIVTDQQIGFSRINEELIPTHDAAAMDVVQQVAYDLQPDEIVILGDNLDLACLSRFEKGDPTVVHTIQAALDTFHNQLAQYRANAPNSKITILEGNHEERWMKYIRANAGEALGIRRANAAKELSVLSLEFLLRIGKKDGEIDAEYLAGYPANKYWINDRLKVIHGSVVRSSGSTAAAVAKAESTSTIFGHVHRIEEHYTTDQRRDGGHIVSAHTFGTLARIDGAVPSYHQGRDADNRHLTQYENWQQGLGIVSFRKGDSPYRVFPALIDTFDNHATQLHPGGKIYTPRKPRVTKTK